MGLNFSNRKLPRESAATLRLCPVAKLRPFVALPAPVYVFLKANEKFVAVKGPLDYFTPEDLERLKDVGQVFLPEFTDSVEEFTKAGRQLRALLNSGPETNAGKAAPFELSDASLRITGALWSRDLDGVRLESFFVAAFVTELCGHFEAETIQGVHDRDVTAYEQATFHSAWAVLLAIHLGYTDIAYLSKIRLRVFASTAEGIAVPGRDEVAELAKLIWEILEPRGFTELLASDFNGRPGRVAPKLVSRLARVDLELASVETPRPTIFGERGFLHE